jgi:double zinc ribbon protein
MARCPHCEREVDAEFRFCPGCGEPLRLKLVEFFTGADPAEHRSLRVSRYLETGLVRFSVWDETGTVRAAVSLDDDEAERLASFVGPARRLRERLLEDVRAAFSRH